MGYAFQGAQIFAPWNVYAPERQRIALHGRLEAFTVVGDVHRCLKAFIVVGTCTSLSECVHRCLNAFTIVWMGPTLPKGSAWVQFRSASFRPSPFGTSFLRELPTRRGRHTTFWLNRHDSVKTYIVPFLSGGYRPGMRLILNFSKLFLKIVWKYRFFIYLCIVVVLNVSN